MYLFCLLFCAPAAFAQLSGSYNVGAGGDYTTISAALSDYNSASLTGPVTFVLTDAAYAAETFPLTINNNTDASATNTLTIKPAAGTAVSISDASGASVAVFKLLDARYINIDGVNSGGSALSITNTNLSQGAAIWLSSTSGLGAGCKNISLRNMRINGADYSIESNWGILAGSDDVTPSTFPGMDNDSVTIQGNTFLSCGYGIYAEGNDVSSAGGLDSWVITNNTVGPAAAGTTGIGYEGIHLGSALNATITGNTVQHIGFDAGAYISAIGISLNNNVTGAIISSNTISNVSSDASTSSGNANTGLYLGYNVSNVTADGNVITGISNTSTFGYGVRGIIVSTDNSPANITLSNNMVSDIWCFTDASIIYGPVGIDIEGGTGGVNLYYNSVYLFGPHEGYTTYSSSSAAFYMDSYIGGIDVRDNVFVNAYDNSSSTTDKSYAIYSEYDASSFTAIDYNDYYVYAPTGVLANIDFTDVTTLPDLISSFGGNTHSIQAAPAFVSETDLHLQMAGVNALLVAGQPITGITADIDDSLRSTTTPVMGADEVHLPNCTTVVAGTAVADTSSFCASGSTTINLPTATAGLGITYQWFSSTDSITFSPVSGATTTSFITPVISTTTYFKVVLVCTFSGITDSAFKTLIVHPLPVITVSPDGDSICTGNSTTLTASGASTYSWSPGGGLSVTSGATVSATPSITTTYAVVGTDVFGCQNTHSAVVNVTFTPSAVVVSPSDTAICSGDHAMLTASSTIEGPAVAIEQTFNSGLGAWTIDNTGSTTTYPDVTWTVHGDGYENEIDIYHSPDNSNFILTNSDTAGSGVVVHTMLISPAFSLVNYSDAALTFDHVFQAYFLGDISASVDISSDGGTTWSNIHEYVGGGSIGSPEAFETASFDLTDYLGMANLNIRFNYNSVFGYFWALDNIKVSGTINAPVSAVVWSPATNLYTDAGLTTPYTGGAATTVYAAATAGSAPVLLTYTATATNGICSNTGTATVTVNPLPVANAIAGSSSVCAGTSITLTETSTGGTWMSSNANATVSSAGVVNGITAGTATISYVVSGSCGNAVATKVITINPAPNAGTITGASSVCVSSSISLADGISGGVWVSSNANATVSSTGVVNGISAGTAIISYTTTNICGSATATKLISINALPDAGTLAGATALCAGSTTTLTDAITGGTWSASNTNATVSASGMVTAVTAGTVTITYTITNVCGSAFTTRALTINPLPNVYAITGGGTYCEGGSGVNVGLSSSQTGVNYQLYNHGTPIGTSVAGTGLAINFGMQTDTGTYTSSAINVTTGCSTNMSGSTTVRINPTASPSVSIATSSMSDTVCSATAVTFTPIPVNGGDSPSYIWSVNGSVVSAFNSYSYIPVNGDVVSVQITSSSCASPDTSSNFVVITVTSAVLPSVSIVSSTGSDSSCAGFPVTFTAIAVNGGGEPMYRWTRNGINVATGPTFTFVPDEGDVLHVMLHSSSACSIADSVYSTDISLHNVPVLTPTITLSAHPGFTVTAGSSDTIYATIGNAGTAPTFEWLINGIPVPGATTATFVSNTFANGDIVSSYVTSSGLCSGITAHASATIYTSVTDVANIKSGINDIRIMPNPNKGLFTIKGSIGYDDATAGIEILDMLGQVVYNGSAAVKKGQLNEQIELSNTLANGMYILNIQSGEEKAVFHFVMEH